MNRYWGLMQGLIGTSQQSLSPSMTAVGQNTYLTRNDFFKMLAVAMLIEAVILGIAGLWPEERVTDIPVRALTFKIGGADKLAAFGAPIQMAPATPVAPQPITPPASTASQWRAAPAPIVPKPKPQPVKQAKVIPITPKPQPRAVPVENRPDPAPQPQPTQQALPDTSVLTSHAAIAPNPQRFIRETGTAAGVVGGQAAETTLTQATVQQVREKYELEISNWIQRHKLYPTAAGGREGRAVVRMRIDRTGYVRYYALEESSGNPVLDAAAIDMIRRANPLPAVPAAYPAGNLIEFLIPIVFRSPR